MMIKNRGAGVELLAAKSFSCQAISFNQTKRCELCYHPKNGGKRAKDKRRAN